MKQKFYNKEKFQAIVFPIVYFLLTIAIVVTGCVIFYNKYYQPILVDGNSMHPTLVGGGSAEVSIDGHPLSFRSHYGIADLHRSAVNNLKRFDVCVTYYPASWAAEEGASIIKRVWGFPGETLNLTYNAEVKTYTFTVSKASKKIAEYKAPVVEITRNYECVYNVNGKAKYKTVSKTFTQAAKFNVGNKIFYVNAKTSRTFTKELAKNEYFVMGDNWASSTDSYLRINNPDLLTKKYIQGKAICINAYATARGDEAKAIHKIKPVYNF